MALNGSGPISLAGATAGQSIAVELGLSSTGAISLNQANVRTLAGVPSGTIIMPTNFYGKANQFTYTVSSNQTNFCMRAGAVSAGWNTTSALVVNINSGVIISSNSTGTPGMTISGSYPGGVTVTNSGTIVGMGGSGASARRNNSGLPGSAGGTALKVCSPVTFNNTPGTIAGGGGGGGSGGTGNSFFACCGVGPTNGGGGGGGRTGSTNSPGGDGGPGPFPAGSPGGAGTYAGAGGGGGGGPGGPEGGGGGPGGAGGTWGAVGGSGSTGASCGGRSSPYTYGGGGGGGGGKATCGAPTYITWTGNGTRFGSIS